MSRSTFIRISGWALALAGMAFFLIFLLYYLDETNPQLNLNGAAFFHLFFFFGFYAGPLLLSVGMLGLRVRYIERVGAAGSGVLLFGAVTGTMISLFGIIGTIFNDSLMSLLFYGPVVSMLFLTIFGIFALGSKPLPRGNALPLLSGIVLPVIMGIGFIVGVIDRNPVFLYAPLIIQFLAMILLGLILQGDVPPQNETLAAA